MKMKAGMWFRDSFGFERVLMSSTPDGEGDLYHMKEKGYGWHYSQPNTIEFEWTSLRRASWIAFPQLRHRTATGWADHTIRAVYSPDGRKAMIMCGCRAWPSLAEAKRHYRTRQRDHLMPTQNESFNAWALRYLDRLEEAMRERRAVKVLRKMVAQRRAA